MAFASLTGLARGADFYAPYPITRAVVFQQMKFLGKTLHALKQDK